MKRNESTSDRIVRVVIGVLAVVAIFTLSLPTWANVVLGVVGAIMIVTAATGFCLLYRVFGVSTCAVDPKPSSD